MKNFLLKRWYNDDKSRKGECKKVYFNLSIGLGFLFYVHGAGAVFPIFFTILFHVASIYTAGVPTVGPATTWVLAAVTIFAKEPNWPLKKYLTFGFMFGNKFAFMDRGAWAGEYSWHLSMNLVLLRLISYSLDRHWAATNLKFPFLMNQKKKVVLGREKGKPREIVVDELYKARVETDLPLESYTLVNSLSHALYAPLFLAGPTIPFNAYMSYCGHGDIDRYFRIANGDVPPHVYWEPDKLHVNNKCWEEIFLYWGKTFVAFWYLERGSSLVYPFALGRSGLLSKQTPAMQGAAVWFTLCLMWLKFLVLWR